jgi:hypothetical protein
MARMAAQANPWADEKRTEGGRACRLRKAIGENSAFGLGASPLLCCLSAGEASLILEARFRGVSNDEFGRGWRGQLNGYEVRRGASPSAKGTR